MDSKFTHLMTDEEFERYLKKYNLTGMAAAAAGAKRRGKKRAIDLANNGLPETVTTSLGTGHVIADNGDGTITLVHEGGMNEVMDKADIPKMQTQYIDIGPKTFSEAMGIYRIIILDAERKGREGIIPEVQRMAKLADQLPEAIAIIKGLQQTVRTGEYPRTRIDAFLSQFEA